MADTLNPVQSAGFVLLVWFLAYLALILRATFRRPADRTGDPSAFSWHFVVPCLDEEEVVGPTVRRLRTSFPEAHVWVVDDDSADSTRDVIREVARDDLHVHLVTRLPPAARKGKGPALNTAYRRIDSYLRRLGDDAPDRASVIVAVVDADGALAEGALAVLAGPSAFGSPDIGAVQVRVTISNTGDAVPRPTTGSVRGLRWAVRRWLVRCQDIEFQATIAAMQSLRMTTGSTGLGGNGQLTRLSVLDAVKASYGGPWHGSLLEDYELGVHTILVGSRTAYVHDTWVAQQGLTSVRAYLRQRSRWAQGGMQCARYIPDIVRSPHFSNSGVIEACYFLLAPWVGVLGLVLWPAVVVSVLLYADAHFAGLGAWAREAWWVWPLFLATGVAPFALWGFVYRRRCRPDASLLRALGWGIGHWAYMYLNHLVLLRALGRMVRRRVGWETTVHRALPSSVAGTAGTVSTAGEPVVGTVRPTAGPAPVGAL